MYKDLIEHLPYGIGLVERGNQGELTLDYLNLSMKNLMNDIMNDIDENESLSSDNILDCLSSEQKDSLIVFLDASEERDFVISITTPSQVCCELSFQKVDCDQTNKVLVCCRKKQDSIYDYLQKIKMDSLGKLSGGVAHDFNNILSIVEGYGRLIEKRLESGSTEDEYIQKILEAVKRGSSLTLKLLAFSRQKIMLEKAEDIVESVKQEIEFMKPILGHDIDVEYQGLDQSIYIDTAPDVINQIVMNLMINSRDAMNRKGKITVTLTDKWSIDFGKASKQDFIYLSVADTGCGIDKKIQKHIFDPFFTTKDQGAGTGLGLSTVHGLVTQMKGFINFKTEPDKGTIFYISLPISKQSIKQNDKVVEIKKLQNDPLSLIDKTILIAEDEKEIRFLLKNSLENIGMRVLTAPDGNAALLMQEDFDGAIDFLLTDIVMPEMNGAHLAEMFQSLRPETDVLFMSGYPGRESYGDIEFPKDAKIIMKPVNVDEIICLMQNIGNGADEEEIEKIYQNIRTA